MAGALRSQFEGQISSASTASAGLTPFGFAFIENRYQFLTASAERLFSQDLLEDFVERLRTWAETAVGTSHVSTPQTRVYLGGCSRKLLRDDVTAPWHYLLSLSRTGPRQRCGLVNVLTPSNVDGTTENVIVNRAVRTKMTFNQLVVHDTRCAYAVDPVNNSANVLDGVVLLDGYLW